MRIEDLVINVPTVEEVIARMYNAGEIVGFEEITSKKKIFSHPVQTPLKH